MISHDTFLIVGGGKMGEAILSGWLAPGASPAGAVSPADFQVVNPGEAKRIRLREAYDVECVADVASARRSDVVVLAVKPQVMMGVLDEISSLPAFQGGPDGPLFVSIAAGLTTRRLGEALPAGAPLVRVMPNMPLMVGAGACAVCGSETASEGQVRYVADLFGRLGRSVIVDEDDMDAVCAVSGSGPAYVAAMVEAMRDAAAAQGLEAELAEALALQTVLGTARLIVETGASPREARESICSPGGTTLAALDAMNAAGFQRVFDEGIAAAVARSKELAQS